MWVLLRSGTLVLGLVLQATFDRLTGDAPASLDVWSLVGLVSAIEFGRLAVQFGVVITWLEPECSTTSWRRCGSNFFGPS